MGIQHRGVERRDRAVGDGRRGGFTLVELLVVAAIIGVLAGLAIPNLRTMVFRARAVEVAGDMEVVRVATLNYHADQLGWPGEAAEGSVPSELVPFLPENFSFSGDGYTLDFENWSLPGGLPGDPSTNTLIGVSVNTADPALGNALVELLGSAVVFSVGNVHTVVIDRN